MELDMVIADPHPIQIQFHHGFLLPLCHHCQPWQSFWPWLQALPLLHTRHGSTPSITTANPWGQMRLLEKLWLVRLQGSCHHWRSEIRVRRDGGGPKAKLESGTLGGQVSMPRLGSEGSSPPTLRHSASLKCHLAFCQSLLPTIYLCPPPIPGGSLEFLEKDFRGAVGYRRRCWSPIPQI